MYYYYLFILFLSDFISIVQEAQANLPSATLRQCRINVDTTSWHCTVIDATLYKSHLSAGYKHVLERADDDVL